MVYKADNFFIFTPISLKIYMKQLHKITNKIIEADFWIFVAYSFFGPF